MHARLQALRMPVGNETQALKLMTCERHFMERKSFMEYDTCSGYGGTISDALRCWNSVMSSRTCKCSHSRLFTFSLLPYMQLSTCIICLLIEYSQTKAISKSFLCRVSSLFQIILSLTNLQREKYRGVVG